MDKELQSLNERIAERIGKDLVELIPADQWQVMVDSEVLKVARAMVNKHSEFRSGDYNYDYHECIHCEGTSDHWVECTDEHKIKHKTDCPVLVAKDLLT